MAQEQTTVVGDPESCDEACSEFFKQGWTLHSVVSLGEFFKSNSPNGPRPYLAYVLIR